MLGSPRATLPPTRWRTPRATSTTTRLPRRSSASAPVGSSPEKFMLEILAGTYQPPRNLLLRGQGGSGRVHRNRGIRLHRRAGSGPTDSQALVRSAGPLAGGACDSRQGVGPRIEEARLRPELATG